MRIRKVLFDCFVVALFCFSLVLVHEAERRWCESDHIVPFPTRITVNGFSYTELDQETIQNLNLAVDSRDGLKEIGKLTEIGKINSDTVFLEHEADGTDVLRVRRTTLKNKKDYDARGTSATIDETVYAYPAPQYPNLLVAILDGEPAIFEIGAIVDDRKVSKEEFIRNCLGLDGGEKIREVCVQRLHAPPEPIEEAEVTDQEALETFYGAITSLSATGEKDKHVFFYYPYYVCRIDLENGFSRELRYSPGDNVVVCNGVSFESNDVLNQWIISHGAK